MDSAIIFFCYYPAIALEVWIHICLLLGQIILPSAFVTENEYAKVMLSELRESIFYLQIPLTSQKIIKQFKMIGDAGTEEIGYDPEEWHWAYTGWA